MPIVRVEMLAGRSAELKQRMATEMTALVARLCNSDPAHIYVIFNDVQHHDWAVAGQVFPSPAARSAATEPRPPKAQQAAPKRATRTTQRAA